MNHLFKILFFTIYLLHVNNAIGQRFFTDQANALDVDYTRGVSGVLGGFGVSVADFNQDGLDDITLCSRQGEGFIMYQNTGLGFSRLATPLIQNTRVTKTAIWVDFDNDGDKDFFLTEFQGPNRLFQNDGQLGFTDITLAVGLPIELSRTCLLYTSPSPRDATLSRMPSSA